jgi:hypothetical protein
MRSGFARNSRDPARRTEPDRAGGVLDTIADGLSIVLERPQIMVLPLVIDLVLWLILQVSLKPLAESLAHFIETTSAADSQLAAQNLRLIGERVLVSDVLSLFLPSIFSGVPLDSFLDFLVMVLAPDIGFGIDRDAVYGSWGSGLAGVWTPGSVGAVALVGAVCVIGGSLLLALYRVPLARAVRGDTAPGFLREVGTAWLHFLAYLLLLACVAVAALIPLFIASLVFLVLGFNLVFVITMALLVFGGMVGIYTLFMVDAMLLHQVGPVRAFTASMAVGRTYFAHTSRFALAALLLSLGVLHIWPTLVDSAPGLAVAIVINAFLGTGLTIAGMLFYSDRFRLNRAAQRANGAPAKNHWNSR